jgi:tRNA(fMet)-specific endonuclease VapC
LDTTALIEILEKRSKIGEELYSTIIESEESICTTSINLQELLYGLRKFNKPTKELLQLPIVDYSKCAALLSAQIEYELEKNGTPVRRTDSMIAGVAINEMLPLLTLDSKHFDPIAKKFSSLKFFQGNTN